MPHPNCFIHYTGDTLDAKTEKTYWRIKNGHFLPKEKEQVDSYFNSFSRLSYEEHAGVVPNFSYKDKVSALVDGNGYKTLKVTRIGGVQEFNILFIHGGCFFMRLDAGHTVFCDKLLSRMNTAIYLPLYPLAPAHRVQESFDMLLEVYNGLLEDGKPVYIMGDSSGANLTLCFTLYLKDLGVRLPDAVFPLSPCCDITFENPDIKGLEGRDPMISLYFASRVQAWPEPGMSLRDPKVSPLFGDLRGMPRTLLYVGTEEILYPDVMLFYDKMKEAGVEVGLLCGKGLWHVAPAYDIPAGDQYIDEVINFMKYKSA